MPGWKARIGYLSPSVFETPSDWDLILPSGFTLVATGLHVRAHSHEEFGKAVEALDAAVSVFKAEEVDALLLGGIAIGVEQGYAAERKMVSSLSQRFDLPITTAMNANTEALKHLGARRVVVATAYKAEINQAVKRYFEDSGLEVVGIRGLNVARPVDQVKLPQYASYRAARQVFLDHPAADAVLVHGRWPSVAYVEELERDTGRPVVSSVAASLWWALRVLGMKLAVSGYGQLLRGAATP